MRQGWRVSATEQLAAVQRRCRADLAWLSSATRALRDPVPVRISGELKAFQDQVTPRPRTPYCCSRSLGIAGLSARAAVHRSWRVMTCN
jgi:hypothetical protein